MAFNNGEIINAGKNLDDMMKVITKYLYKYIKEN